MERKMGEIFKFNDIKLQVIENVDPPTCIRCYFSDKYCFNPDIVEIIGECHDFCRLDENNVYFKEIKKIIK